MRSLAAAWLLALGCNGTPVSDDSGRDDAGMDASSSDGGAAVDASGSDAGGGDADTTDAGFPPSECPTLVPEDGAPCDIAGLRCTYVDCPGDGVAQIECADGSYTVVTEACGPHDCSFVGGPGSGEMCEADELCVARIGGAFLVSCEANPCDDGPIVPECACEICAGTFGCMLDGRSVTCQTCPPGEPCP